ncbi:MAG: AMP nucleosidase, partial [Comamonas sp.]
MDAPQPQTPSHRSVRFSEAADALRHLQTLYQQQIAHLRSAMQAYVEGPAPAQPVHAWYPLLRIEAPQVRR